MVTRGGFEPTDSAVKGQYLNHLTNEPLVLLTGVEPVWIAPRDFLTTIAFTTCLCMQFVVWNQSSSGLDGVCIFSTHSLSDWHGITIG